MLGFGNSATGNLEIVARYRGDEAATKVRQLGTDVRGVGNAGKEAAGGLNQAEAATGKFAAGARSLQSVLGGLFAGYLGIQGIRLLKDFTTGVYESRLALEAASGVVSRQMIPLGIDYTRVLGDMRKATLGLVDDVTLLQNTGRAMLAFTASGLSAAKAYETITTAAQFAALSSRAFGIEAEQAMDRIITGLARGSPQILDDFGIMIDLQSDMFKGLDQTAQKAAVLNEVMNQMRTFIDANNDAIGRQVSALARLSTAWENAKVAFGNYLAQNIYVQAAGVTLDQIASILTPTPPPRQPNTPSGRMAGMADYRALQGYAAEVRAGEPPRPNTWQTAFPDLSADATTLGVNAPQQWGGLGESEWILRNVGVEVGQVISQAAVSVIREEIGLLPTIDTSDIIARASQPSYGQRFETSFASGLAAPFSPEALGGQAASFTIGLFTQGVQGFLDATGVFSSAADKQAEAARHLAEALASARSMTSANVAQAEFLGKTEMGQRAQLTGAIGLISRTVDSDPNFKNAYKVLKGLVGAGELDNPQQFIDAIRGQGTDLFGPLAMVSNPEVITEFYSALSALESSLDANTDAINAQTRQMEQDLFDAEFRALTSNMLTGARSPEQIRSIVQQRSAEYSMLDPYAAGVYGGGVQNTTLTIVVHGPNGDTVTTVEQGSQDGTITIDGNGTVRTTGGSSGYANEPAGFSGWSSERQYAWYSQHGRLY